MTPISSKEPSNASVRKESSTSSETQHFNHGNLASRKHSSKNSDTYNPFRIFEAKPIPELPSKAHVKWPRPRKLRLPKIIRRSRELHPLRNQVHIRIAQESSLNRKICSVCGVECKYGNFDVHHINGDHNDNRPENLTVLCRDCHINVEHGYSATTFPSDMDGVHIEESDGVIEDETSPRPMLDAREIASNMRDFPSDRQFTATFAKARPPIESTKISPTQLRLQVSTPSERECALCGSKMIMVATYGYAHFYRCINDECGWQYSR